MARKHAIPGPAHNLGDAQTSQLWSELQECKQENTRLRAQLMAEQLVDEYVEDVDERRADEFARLREKIAELETRLAVKDDLARAKR